MRTTRTCALLVILACALCEVASAQTEPLPLKLGSPDGRLEITFALDGQGAPSYSVAYGGQPVIAPSALGLEFKRGGLLSRVLPATSA
jgi:hypothetical protein